MMFSVNVIRFLCLLLGHRWQFNRDDWRVVLFDLPTAVCSRCGTELPNVMQVQP